MIIVFVALNALIISIALLVALSIYIRPSYIVLFFTATVAFISYLYIIFFLKKVFIDENTKKKDSFNFWLLSYLMFMSLIILVPIGYFINVIDQNKYTRNLVNTEKSMEYYMVKKLANNNVFIRLGNTNTAWASTRLLIPDASGASLSLYNGYCGLNYDDESSRDMKNGIMQLYTKSEIDRQKMDFAKLAIMVHEFGHCVDIKRDFIGFNISKIQNISQLIIAKEAIVPKKRNSVTDIESYLVAAQESSLWKEVFADVYSIGYIYIYYPEQADTIANGIKLYREKNSVGDPAHNTSCYIELIKKSSKPKNEEDLIRWADSIRGNRKCSSNFY